MKNVLIASPKGGVGKTTIADELMFLYESQGMDVGFVTLDNQGGSMHTTMNSDDTPDVVVIDSPGRLDDATDKVMRSSHLVVVPMLPSIRDVEPTLRFFRHASKYAPTILVLNRVDLRRVSDKSVVEFLDGQGVEVSAMLPDAAVFARAPLEGVGVTSSDPRSRAASAVVGLGGDILRRIGVK